MSPDITPAVRPPNPTVEIIRKAVNAAHAAGLTVSTVPDLGVVCTSTARPKWEPEAFAPAVSVLGAVLLAHQPPVADPDAALRSVFGSRSLFHEGIEDGVAGRQPAITDRLYANGFAAGAEFRAVLHRRQGVPIERPDDEPTNPLQIDTPRSLIAELLNALTPSQGLEALADSCRARAPKLPPDLADDLAIVEETLREMAEELRGVQ